MKARHRRGENGYALFAVMVVVAIVTVWMTNAALVAGYGVLAAANTRDRLNARIAVNERASGAVADGLGGSVWPSAPVEGFCDYLVLDSQTGRFKVVAGAVLPPSGPIILRQWRLAPNADGGRLFEVSAVIVDAATRSAIPPPAGGEFRRSHVVE